MTIRAMPKLPTLAARSGISFDIAPEALSRFDAAIRAAAEDNTDATISILGPIGETWDGTGVTDRRIAAALRSIGDRDVTVAINSPGGDFFQGVSIHNMLRDHPRQVTVKVLGIAASAASVIAMAGDHILVPRAGFLMIHNVWAVAVGNRHDLRDFADALEPFDQASADLYAARSGLATDEVQEMMDRETYLSGTQAVEKGFADDLLPADRVSKDGSAAVDDVAAALHMVDIHLAKAGMPRSERRRLFHTIKTGTSRAAEEATPRAGLKVNGELATMLAGAVIR